ncbi:tryptophan synthase subunit alpha [bacterium SCN 62-11]|nr:tryptophan synthase subunit alpha [Candidatus Eremiobacteraeota bacterium]ODT58757.1 MAG: tryptophan synthase subunit alpha [bacterium SCN 62-11]
MLELNSASLLPYFTAGWPSPESFVASVQAAAESGCPAFEVGIPFTDPVADGPVIQRTSSQALEAGVNWREALRLTGLAVQKSGIPAIAMTYCNPLYALGLERACQELAQAGCRGLIVPDLTLEEGEPMEKAATAAGLDLIYLVAPTTPDDRVEEIVRRSRGFVYLVSLRGVTGARQELPEDLMDQVRRVKKSAELPVMVGFGISTPAQAASVAAQGAGVIVGSALLRAIGEAAPERAGEVTREFLSQMVQAMRHPEGDVVRAVS